MMGMAEVEPKPVCTHGWSPAECPRRPCPENKCYRLEVELAQALRERDEARRGTCDVDDCEGVSWLGFCDVHLTEHDTLRERAEKAEALLCGLRKVDGHEEDCNTQIRGLENNCTCRRHSVVAHVAVAKPCTHAEKLEAVRKWRSIINYDGLDDPYKKYILSYGGAVAELDRILREGPTDG